MKPSLLFALLACALLSGCASTSCYPGGEVKKDSLTNSKMPVSFYRNHDLDLFSNPTFWVEGIAISDKYLRKASLPKAYCHYLTDSTNGTQLLYTIKFRTWQTKIKGRTYLVATITRPLANPTAYLSSIAANNAKLPSELSPYATKWFRIKNHPQKSLFFHYGLYKNRKRAFSVKSFHVIWQNNRVISITSITDARRLTIDYTWDYVVDELFKSIPYNHEN